MRYLVTGATGFVGHHVASLLIQQGVPVRLLTRGSSRQENIEALPRGDVEIAVGDLTDRASLDAAIANCDALYHIAADYRLWSKDPGELYRANVEGTRTLLSAAKQAGVSRVVYCSTVGVLGIPHDGSPGTEDTEVAESEMIGHYKRSKFQAEVVAREFATNGLPVVIVNPSTPIGENDIKPTPTGQIILDFLNGRLPAYIDTGLNLVDVRDVATGILLAGERGTPGERYILANRNISLREMLGMLGRIAGRRPPVIRMPYAVAWCAVGLENLVAGGLGRVPAHPFEGVKMARHRMFFDGSKAVRRLGMPQSPIEDALERAIVWFNSNGYVKARR